MSPSLTSSRIMPVNNSNSLWMVSVTSTSLPNSMTGKVGVTPLTCLMPLMPLLALSKTLKQPKAFSMESLTAKVQLV